MGDSNPQENSTSHTSPKSLPSDLPFDCLSNDVTHEQVSAALKQPIGNKVAGVNGIEAEIMLNASNSLLIEVAMPSNQVLEHGLPAICCVGIIHCNLKARGRNMVRKGVSYCVSSWPS